MRRKVIRAVIVELAGRRVEFRGGTVECGDPGFKAVLEAVLNRPGTAGYAPSQDEAAARDVIEFLGYGEIVEVLTDEVEEPDDAGDRIY